jgi:uncharacterized membrane protein (UPF0127 family)
LRYGRIYTQPEQRLLLDRVMRATTTLERMRGLLFREPPGPREGMLLAPCSSVHTFGMHYPIDLVFLTRNWRVRRVEPSLKPLRIAWSLGAAMVLELASGTAAALGIAPDQELLWKESE